MAGLFEDAVRIVVTAQDGAKATYEPGMFGRMKATFTDGDVCQVEDPDGGFVLIDITTGSPHDGWTAHLRSQ
jgi:ferredoxin-NADP reductase